MFSVELETIQANLSISRNLSLEYNSVLKGINFSIKFLHGVS